ncbi:MAG: hypothetical protein E7337_06015 [Clostridiales bacterium]|nr:hypothetical protein [Clostridiales bacterium]
MKRLIIFLFRIIEIVIVLSSILICMGYQLSGHDDLDFGLERISGITGYALNTAYADLVLHQSNPSDSVVMVVDTRATEIIIEQMDELIATDARWKRVQIAESEAYDIIVSYFSNSYQTNQHFRPVCEISGGYYDYLFYEKEDFGIKGCIVDVDTGTIALYIFNTNLRME